MLTYEKYSYILKLSNTEEYEEVLSLYKNMVIDLKNKFNL